MLLALLGALALEEIPADSHGTRVGPGVYATDGLVNALPAADWKGTAAEWHEAVWQDLCRDVKATPERTTGTAGAVSSDRAR